MLRDWYPYSQKYELQNSFLLSARSQPVIMPLFTFYSSHLLKACLHVENNTALILQMEQIGILDYSLALRCLDVTLLFKYIGSLRGSCQMFLTAVKSSENGMGSGRKSI